MTKQVRVTYRSHRRAAWVVMLALVGVLAAVVIPLANGGSGKTYTLAATPTTTCASPAKTTVTIKNTGSPQTLGSAEIYFPSKMVASAVPGDLFPDSTSSAQPQKRDIVRLDGLNLAPNKWKDIVVTFKVGATFNTKITAVAKQSNRFNDSSGTANVFTLEDSFPTLKIATCVTIIGSVYLDRSQAPSFATGAGTFNDVYKPWTVNLFEKVNGVYGPLPTQTTTASSSLISDALGQYTYKFAGVPTGSDYEVCVVAAGADASSAWAVTAPSGNTGCQQPLSSSSSPPANSPGAC